MVEKTGLEPVSSSFAPLLLTKMRSSTIELLPHTESALPLIVLVPPISILQRTSVHFPILISICTRGSTSSLTFLSRSYHQAKVFRVSSDLLNHFPFNHRKWNILDKGFLQGIGGSPCFTLDSYIVLCVAPNIVLSHTRHLWLPV